MDGVFITGAAGVIGRTLAARYRSLGVEVRGVDALDDPAQGIVAGDVSTSGPWQDHAAGCDLVIHTAAIVNNSAPLQRCWEVNVLGARRAIDAAVAGGARRVVHLSSVRAFSDLDFPDGVDESHPVRPDGHRYVDTKVASEQVALQAHAAGEVPVTVIRRGVGARTAGNRGGSRSPGATQAAPVGCGVADRGRSGLGEALVRRRLLVVLFAVVALIATGCDLRLVAPDGPAPLRYRDAVFTAVTKTADVTYGSATNQQGQVVTLKMDIYEPTGDTISARPVIVLVHGGSFRSGTKTSAELVDQANVYAKQGYVTASISYRLATNGCTSITLECITAIRQAKNDAQAAVRYLRSRSTDLRLDTGRMAMAGSSAGAITAVEVGYGPDEVGDSGNPGYDSTIRAAVSLSGAKILTTPEAGEAAVLLLHSTGDPVVPYQWATNTVTAAETAGTYLEITSWDETSHVPYTAHRTEILSQTSNFLYWNLDLTHAAR